MSINFEALIQFLMGASILGLFGWVFRMQARISDFVTWDKMRAFQENIDNNFRHLHDELKKLATDLAYLRGQSDK